MNIRAIIQNEENSQPLANVHVFVSNAKGQILDSSKTTTTNSKGEFTLTVNVEDKVAFTHLGFKPTLVPAQAFAGKFLSVLKLKPTATQLNEFVVKPKKAGGLLLAFVSAVGFYKISKIVKEQSEKEPKPALQ